MSNRITLTATGTVSTNIHDKAKRICIKPMYCTKMNNSLDGCWLCTTHHPANPITGKQETENMHKPLLSFLTLLSKPVSSNSLGASRF
ncbi:hypothetical protein MASSI9I_50218 [Massilia sp. 9I]|nr:hypothetical protein MASSI9I_50218 [Massilia sp. 9I]